MSGPHDKIIAEAAKAALGPLGFEREGRSRKWRADRGWWLAVADFEGSAWRKGGYLNVGVRWLWSEVDGPFPDFGGRIGEFEEYQSDEQFASAAAGLAQQAADEVQRLAGIFASSDATADLFLDRERALPERAQGRWPAYHAGIAAGLAGRMDAAAAMFEAVLRRPSAPGWSLHPAAERMARLVGDPATFRREVAAIVGRRRDGLGLPAADVPF